MRITFTKLEAHPTRRDAVGYFNDGLYDSNIRYLLHIFIEGPALLGLAADVPGETDDIVQELFCEELATLLAAGELSPEGSRRVNSVFFFCGNESKQTQADDIPVPYAYERLKAVARRMGRLAP